MDDYGAGYPSCGCDMSGACHTRIARCQQHARSIPLPYVEEIDMYIGGGILGLILLILLILWLTGNL